MARCASCGATILLGGPRRGDSRFCNDRCLERQALVVRSQQIPATEVERRVWEVHQGSCPKCRGRGPVDLHVSYWVWSAVLLTRWGSTPELSCRRCGSKAAWANLGGCLLLGWWGFPWGLIFTPVQLTRNVLSIARGPDPLTPSASLKTAVRAIMVTEGTSARMQADA